MPEHVMSAPHLQRELSLIQQALANAVYIDQLARASPRDHRRVLELQDPGVDHGWLWKVNPRDGSRLAHEDYVLALQARLGANIAASDLACRVCGEALDPQVSHASCCAQAESTRGHYAVVAAVADGIALADGGVQREVQGLTSTADRPADILTVGAIPGTTTALDVTIASQKAVQAGLDACASAFRRKVRRYSSILPELRQAGITFQPMVWSCEGRPHPATVRIMEFTLAAIGRKLGAEQVPRIRERWRHEIAVAIQRRKAAMIRSCLPLRGLRQEWLLSGKSTYSTSREEAGGPQSRLPAIPEEPEESDKEDASQ